MSDWSGLSATSVGPASLCPAREALPKVRETSSFAARGNALHEFARRVSGHPEQRAAALEAIENEDWRRTASGMNLGAALDGLEIHGAEVAFALDVKNYSCRRLGENIDRKYEKFNLQEWEIPFTVDIHGMWHDIPLELDWKSGQNIGEVEVHMQRRICAAGLIFYHNATSAFSRVGYIWDDGSIHPDGHEFLYTDAIATCDEAVETILRVDEARAIFESRRMPTVHPSDEACKYCPAMTSCPVYTNMAKSMLGKLEAIENGPELSALSLDELGQMWQYVKSVSRLSEDIEKRLKKIASETPLLIGLDKVVRPKEKSKQFFDDSKARGLIASLMHASGSSDEDIAEKLKSLTGTTHYNEYRTVKR